MCPDRKLKWFKDHGRTAAQIRDIKKIVIKRFKDSYAQDKDSDLQGHNSQVIDIIILFENDANVSH
jgi:hypothetical protein